MSLWSGLAQIASLMRSEILGLFVPKGSSGSDDRLSGMCGGIANVLRRYSSVSSLDGSVLDGSALDGSILDGAELDSSVLNDSVSYSR